VHNKKKKKTSFTSTSVENTKDGSDLLGIKKILGWKFVVVHK
jgi:hypothetical protein